MLRGVLERAGQPEHLRGVLAGSDHGRDERHLAGRHRAGLVQDDGVDLMGLLEDLGALDQDAELRAPTGADHQRGRRGQSQRARAGDDQDGHGRGQRRSRALAACQPEGEGGQRDHDDDRHEDAGDPVGQPLHGGLPGLGVLDQPRHLGELGVGPDAGGAYDQPAARVDASADDGVPDGHVHRHGLAGQHRGVDSGGALLDSAVGRDLLARADDEAVTHGQFGHRDPDLGTGAQHGHVACAQVEQGAQRRPGVPLGAVLEVATEKDERDDAGGGLEVDVGGAVGPLQRQGEAMPHAGHARVTPEERVDRPEEGGAGAERDQGVHRRGAVTQVGPGRPVEGKSAPHHDRRGQRQREPLPVGELPGRHHRQRDDRHRQQRRDDQAGTERGEGHVLRRRHGVVGAIRDRRCGQRRAVPGLLDGGDQVVGADAVRVGHPRLLGGVVDRRSDTVELVELALDPVGAGRAGHPGERELDLRVACRIRRHLGAHDGLTPAGSRPPRRRPSRPTRREARHS